MQLYRQFAHRLLLALMIMPMAIPAAGAAESRAFVVDVADAEAPKSRPAGRWIGATDSMKRAGFNVAALPFDRSPSDLEADVIVLGSFSDGDARVKAYVDSWGKELLTFVEHGGTLVQMAQAVDENLLVSADDDSIPSPAFLPDGLRATRGISDHVAMLADVRVTTESHPLLNGLAKNGRIVLPAINRRGPAWEIFAQHAGFSVLLAAGPEGTRYPVMMEAAHGRGRIVLTTLYVDKLTNPADAAAAAAPAEYAAFADRFFANLRGYASDVRAGNAPAVVAAEPFVSQPPFSHVPGAWTLAVLPDTQRYVQRGPDLFESQTLWIADNAKAIDIRHVLHLGDITNNNNVEQWIIARKSMDLIEGVVPYALVPGNHDLGDDGRAADRGSLMNEYFPVERARSSPTFGGTFEPDRIENSYHTFQAGGQDWIVFALEFGPRDQVLEWANRIYAEHPRHFGIVVTHAYLFNDGTRYDRVAEGKPRGESPRAPTYPLNTLPGGANDGGEVWAKFVSRHPGMRFVLCGHSLGDGVGRRSQAGEAGNVVHEILSNYQVIRPRGGNGFMRLMSFLPDGKTVQVRTYSPSLDAYKTDAENQFTIELTPSPK